MSDYAQYLDSTLLQGWKNEMDMPKFCILIISDGY